jgi:hypothetical protein
VSERRSERERKISSSFSSFFFGKRAHLKNFLLSKEEILFMLQQLDEWKTIKREKFTRCGREWQIVREKMLLSLSFSLSSKKEASYRLFFGRKENVRKALIFSLSHERIFQLMRRIVPLINVRRMRNDATFHRAPIFSCL